MSVLGISGIKHLRQGELFFLNSSVKIFTGYPLKNLNINNDKINFVGQLIREQIYTAKEKNDFKKDNNFDFTLLVIGGSQGAEIFSKILPQSLNKLFSLNKKKKTHLHRRAQRVLDKRRRGPVGEALPAVDRAQARRRRRSQRRKLLPHRLRAKRRHARAQVTRSGRRCGRRHCALHKQARAHAATDDAGEKRREREDTHTQATEDRRG